MFIGLIHNVSFVDKSAVIWLSLGLKPKGVVKEENPLSSQTHLLVVVKIYIRYYQVTTVCDSLQ